MTGGSLVPSEQSSFISFSTSEENHSSSCLKTLLIHLELKDLGPSVSRTS